MKLKRLLSVLLTVLLLLSSVPALAGKVTNGSATDSYCPSDRSDNHTHFWQDWEITKQATCKAAGTKTRTCYYCRYTQTKTIKKLDHQYGSWTVTKKATCTTAGSRYRKCKVCGTKQTQTIKKLEHSWGDWLIIAPATDFSAGTRSHSCTKCGASETKNFDPEGTLRRGDKGDSVKKFQEALNKAGFDCGKADGIFGQNTESAVKSLEAAHSFTADGVAWPGVQKWLSGGGNVPDDINKGNPKTYGNPPKTADLPLSAGYGGSLIALSADLIPPAPYTAGTMIVATCYLYNLSEKALQLDSMYCDNAEYMISSEAWMDPSYAAIAPNSKNPFMVLFKVSDQNEIDGWGTYTVSATAHDPDSTEEESEAVCELTFVIQKDKPSIFVVFDWSYKYSGEVGETVTLPLAVYNNGNTDLKISGYEVIPRNEVAQPGCGDLSYPEEYDTLFEMGDSFEATLTFEIDEYDAAFAADFSDNTMREVRIYADTVDGAQVNDSDYELVTVLDGDTESLPAIRLEVIPKTAQTVFKDGEQQDFTLRLINDTPDDVLYLPRVDAADPDSNLRVEYAASVLPAYDCVEMEDSYTFTPKDAGTPSIALSWVGYAMSEDEEEHISEPVVLEYSVYTDGYIWIPPTEEGGLTVIKKVVGSSKLPQGYQEGETIHYEITITNNSYITYLEIEVYDPLKGSNEDALVDKIFNLGPGSSATVTFDYKVKPGDVDNKKVVNTATIRYMDNRGTISEMDSNKLETPTYRPPKKQTSSGDCCVLTLKGKGEGIEEYRLDYCDEHNAIQTKVKSLVSAAKTEKSILQAWKKAELLWTDALNKEYDRMLSRANDELKQLINEERELFFAQLALKRECLEAEHPDELALVYELIARELMNKTTEICYERHVAPKQRADSRTNKDIAELEAIVPAEVCSREEKQLKTALKFTEKECQKHYAIDMSAEQTFENAGEANLAQAWLLVKRMWLTELDSMTSARYLAADEDTRLVIAADRTAFGEWLEARGKLLEKLYPDQENTVNEVIVRIIKTRVFDSCLIGE